RVPPDTPLLSSPRSALGTTATAALAALAPQQITKASLPSGPLLWPASERAARSYPGGGFVGGTNGSAPRGRPCRPETARGTSGDSMSPVKGSATTDPRRRSLRGQGP